MSLQLSIVIPIYNAHQFIAQSTKKLIDECEQGQLKYEILLRDDGSTDGSRELLDETALKYQQVKCFYNPENCGLGTTLRALFFDARGDTVIYSDCDLPYTEKIIPQMMDAIKSHDIVVASRYRDVENDIKLYRKLASRMYYHLCRLLFHIPVLDVGSGSVAIKRELLEKLGLTAKGFEIHAEIFAKAKIKNFDIKEIPAKVKGGGQSTFSIIKHGPGVVFKTLSLGLHLIKNK